MGIERENKKDIFTTNVQFSSSTSYTVYCMMQVYLISIILHDYCQILRVFKKFRFDDLTVQEVLPIFHIVIKIGQYFLDIQ